MQPCRMISANTSGPGDGLRSSGGPHKSSSPHALFTRTKREVQSAGILLHLSRSRKSEPVVSSVKSPTLILVATGVCLCVCECAAVCSDAYLYLVTTEGPFCGLLLISRLRTWPIVNLPVCRNISGNEA